jgi:hypothetical protein
MCKPPKKMKHDIDMNKTINLTFKLDILYSNMHKYKVHKMENHYIQYFDSTSSICYNNFKGKPTSYKKYWYLIKNNIICKCWSHLNKATDQNPWTKLVNVMVRDEECPYLLNCIYNYLCTFLCKIQINNKLLQ